MGLRWFQCLTISTSTALASVAGAETYTWTGAVSDTDIRWSNPLNWRDGIVPVSSVDSIIEFDQFGSFVVLQDLGENFDVGILRSFPMPSLSYLRQVSIIGGSIRLHHAAIDIQGERGLDMQHYASIEVMGDVSFIETIDHGHPQTGWPISSGYFPKIKLNGHLTIDGNWRIDQITGNGSLHLNHDASLDGGFNAQLTSLTGSGWFDLKGHIEMIGDEPADLTQGTLDLGRNDYTAGTPTHGTANIDGDLDLGDFFIRGVGYSPPQIDRVNVSGTLDLTEANIVPGSWAEVWSGYDGDHLVIASYGNRIGEFPQSTIPWGDFHGPNPTSYIGEIFYTSGENAGPGEIWIVLPEPATALSLMILLPLTLRGRR